MTRTDQFKHEIEEGYTPEGESITLGSAILDDQVISDAHINLPLKSLNRHGLIAGATGTGKTKTIQLLAEGLSNKGVPTLLMDLKGDLSGLAAPGEANKHVKARQDKIGLEFSAKNFPVELLTLSRLNGLKLRATVSEFGPLLFSKILGLNDTQTSVVALLFQYADDRQLALLDLKDFKKILNYAMNEGKQEVEQEYGRISTASGSAILRKMIELEQQGAKEFFGEPSFDVQDLLRIDENGQGYISVLRLSDIQNRPKLFSSFMLCLLAEIYETFPEVGDLDQPKLVLFIDEAHLLFKHASSELLSQLESIIKLIRSKGVGIFFCTQNPVDIPDSILSQLGMKVQHALRAFTAKDRKAIKLAAENYPDSDFYDTDDLLTSLGIGEAAVTVLDEDGRPTPLAATLLCAPQSRMGPLNHNEIDQLVDLSKKAKNYNQFVDRESAYELLTEKVNQLQQGNPQPTAQTTNQSSRAATKKQSSWITSLSKNTLVRQLGRTLMREISRGLMGVLSGKKTR